MKTFEVGDYVIHDHKGRHTCGIVRKLTQGLFGEPRAEIDWVGDEGSPLSVCLDDLRPDTCGVIAGILASKRRHGDLTMPTIEEPIRHTSLPWNIHKSSDGVPFLVSPPGQVPWMAGYLVIAHGDKIIGRIEMSTALSGWPCVDNEAEMRANAELILRDANSHEALLKACKAMVREAEESRVPSLIAAFAAARAAIAKAESP